MDWAGIGVSGVWQPCDHVEEEKASPAGLSQGAGTTSDGMKAFGGNSVSEWALGLPLSSPITGKPGLAVQKKRESGKVRRH